eukprot:jgi/Psemu1/7853/gm1.7853_g
MNQFQSTQTLSSRGQDTIRSELLNCLGVRIKNSPSQDSLDRAMKEASIVPTRFHAKNYKWEQGFSTRRMNSLLSPDELTRLSLGDKKNFKREIIILSRVRRSIPAQASARASPNSNRKSCATPNHFPMEEMPLVVDGYSVPFTFDITLQRTRVYT